MIDFDGVNLLLSLVFSTFGLIYFRYGNRLAKVPWIVTGGVLMVYPYFVNSRLWMVVIGLLLMAIPAYVWR